MTKHLQSQKVNNYVWSSLVEKITTIMANIMQISIAYCPFTFGFYALNSAEWCKFDKFINIAMPWKRNISKRFSFVLTKNEFVIKLVLAEQFLPKSISDSSKEQVVCFQTLSPATKSDSTCISYYVKNRELSK